MTAGLVRSRPGPSRQQRAWSRGQTAEVKRSIIHAFHPSIQQYEALQGTSSVSNHAASRGSAHLRIATRSSWFVDHQHLLEDVSFDSWAD